MSDQTEKSGKLTKIVESAKAAARGEGLTKRQKVAALAMAGILANPKLTLPDDLEKAIWVMQRAETALSHADTLLEMSEEATANELTHTVAKLIGGIGVVVGELDKVLELGNRGTSVSVTNRLVKIRDYLKSLQTKKHDD